MQNTKINWCDASLKFFFFFSLKCIAIHIVKTMPSLRGNKCKVNIRINNYAPNYDWEAHLLLLDIRLVSQSHEASIQRSHNATRKRKRFLFYNFLLYHLLSIYYHCSHINWDRFFEVFCPFENVLWEQNLYILNKSNSKNKVETKMEAEVDKNKNVYIDYHCINILRCALYK